MVRPADKLTLRGRLPGASGYDLAAQSLRSARAHGMPAADLLPPAFPGSWMVNNRVTSPVFQRWMAPPLADAWRVLVELLEGGPEAWLACGDTDRMAVTRAVATVSIEGHGVAAVSKVLALVCPETVPLMDDAALWFALDAVARPADADTPTAGPRWFVPMLDWFSRAVLERYDALVPLARDYAPAPLDAAQVLDRLVWFESWGWRLPYGGGMPRWQWVKDGAMEGVIAVETAAPDAAPGERVDLGAGVNEAWEKTAREALAAG